MGLDGTTMRVADSPENRAAFGGHRHGAGRGESGYPLVRAVAMMALRSHVLSAFRFADLRNGRDDIGARNLERGPGELAGDRRPKFPGEEGPHPPRDQRQPTLAVADQGQHEVGHPREARARTTISSSGTCTRPGLPSTWTLRAIHYKKKGFPRSTLLTSLLDPEKYPAKELVELYHERWETELAYDEVKTHLLDRQESIRSKTPDGVRQELWGIALAYNLVRLEMERAAAKPASRRRESASSLPLR